MGLKTNENTAGFEGKVTKFHVDPEAVLYEALTESPGFDEVIVIGRYKNGRLYIASSATTPVVEAMLARAPIEIVRLRAEED